MENNKIITILLGSIFTLTVAIVGFYYITFQDSTGVKKEANIGRLVQGFSEQSLTKNMGDTLFAQINSAYQELPFIMKTELVGLEDIHEDRFLLWHDEFESAELDETKWSYELGGRFRGNGSELQYYTDKANNVYIEDSILHLKAIRERHYGNDTMPYEWTSASLHTNNKFEFGYGRIEAKLKLDNVEGSFPAFWLLGSNYEYNYLTEANNDKGKTVGYPWSNCGEIDIMELFGHRDNISITLHYKNEIEEDDIAIHVGKITIDTSQWHIYALERTEDSLEFYVDNQVVYSYKICDDMMKEIFNRPMFLLLDQAVGSISGNPSDETNVIDYQVDWVRYYMPSDNKKIKTPSIVKLDKELVQLDNGDSLLLHAQFDINFVSNMTLIWSSSDESVCTCKGGFIKSVGIGESVVTVKDMYGHEANCKVIIS